MDQNMNAFPFFRAGILEEYGKRVKNDCPPLRRGQLLYNIVAATYPVLVENIVGTSDDCFYQDSRIEAFWKKLEENYYNFLSNHKDTNSCARCLFSFFGDEGVQCMSEEPIGIPCSKFIPQKDFFKEKKD